MRSILYGNFRIELVGAGGRVERGDRRVPTEALLRPRLRKARGGWASPARPGRPGCPRERWALVRLSAAVDGQLRRLRRAAAMAAAGEHAPTELADLAKRDPAAWHVSR
jgi:hypothetical protein